MKKILAVLMILALMASVVFAGTGFMEHNGYMINTQARLIKGYTYGEDEEVDAILQLKYSKKLMILEEHEFTDPETIFIALDGQDFDVIKDELTKLFGTENQGYVIIQKQIYTDELGGDNITFDPDNQPVPAIDLEYPPNGGDKSGPNKHVFSYKFVLVENVWTILEGTMTVYEFEYDELLGEWVMIVVDEDKFFMNEDIAPPKGLGKYK